MMKQSVRVLWMVLGGIVGGWAGYWIGHLAGWSTDAEWPWHIGGGTGAILLSMAMSLAGVLVARLAVGPRTPSTPAGPSVRATPRPSP